MDKCIRGCSECNCVNNPHDHTHFLKTQNTQPLSSGRWDASGSWEETIKIQEQKAVDWVVKLSPEELYEITMTMASDVNAYTLYQRKAVLTLFATRLGLTLLADRIREGVINAN